MIHAALVCMLALIVAIAALNDPFVKITDIADDALLPRQLRRAREGLRARLSAGLFPLCLRHAVGTAPAAPPLPCRLALMRLCNSHARIHPFIRRLCNPHHAPPAAICGIHTNSLLEA